MRRQTERGFTLVELLVVIGIVALLVSILLPAINKARQYANMVACASNMRQIATGVLMYATDNRGYFPPNLILDANDGRYYQWFTRRYVGQYVSNSYTLNNYTTARVQICPTIGDASVSYLAGAWYFNGQAGGIGYNCHPNARLWRSAVSGAGTPARLGTVYMPSTVILLGDVNDSALTPGTGGGYMFTQSYNGSGRSLLPAYVGTLYSTDPTKEAIAYRHNNNANVAFADGHVVAFKARVPTDRNWDTHKNDGLDAAINNKEVTFIAR